MTPTGRRRLLVSAWALGIAAAVHGQAPTPYLGTLDEHPSIQYAVRPTMDPVSTLNHALADGTRALARDARSGYLRSVLDALGVPEESQVLVFSKTAVQRDYTSPHNPRALYFNESVVVGYIPGAPVLEFAAHDPQQGVVFYTLNQSSSGAPAFVRQTGCLTCHIAASTLDVPGVIDRSHIVDREGHLMPGEATIAVNHQTPHTDRWGGWFVTGNATAPPYQPMGHLGNMTAAPHPTSGPPILSNHVFIEWLNSAPETRGYLSPFSDLAALLVFNHQTHAINLLTRLNWDARVAASTGAADVRGGELGVRVGELVDYLLFVGEATPVVSVVPRPGFAEHLASRTPSDRKGRSLGELDLDTRLLRYPCSYMVYTAAFDGLPPPIKDAVYRRMFAVLSGRVAGPQYAHLSAADRLAIREILRDTKPDLPADLRR